MSRKARPTRFFSERMIAIARRHYPEIDFRVLTYQALFAELRQSHGVDPGYVEYLARRYFG